MPIKSLSCTITSSIFKLLFPSWLWVQKSSSCCMELLAQSIITPRPVQVWNYSPALGMANGATPPPHAWGAQWVTLSFSAQHCFFCCHSTLPSCSRGEGCLCSPDPFAHSFGCGGGITPTSTTSPDGCRALIQVSAVPSRLDRVNTVHLGSVWGWYTKWLNDISEATKEAGGTVGA